MGKSSEYGSKLFFESYLIQMPIHKLARFTMGECIDNVIDLRFLK